MLRITSFNIRNSQAPDGENSWVYRRNAVAQWLKSESPDIIGAQEVMGDQLEFLSNELAGYRYVGVAREDGGTDGEYAPIFYAADRFRLLDSGTFWLSETPEVPGSQSWDTACTRICTFAKLASDEGEFVVYNCHLDHVSALARQMGMRTILDRVTPPMIVLGDFNAGEHEVATWEVLGHDLIDTFRVCHPSDRYVNTYHAFDPNLIDGEKIDYILCSPDFEVKEAAIRRNTAAGHPLSDHFPVTASVGLKSSSSAVN